MVKKLLLTAIVFLMTFNVCYAEDLFSLYDENIEMKYPTGGIVVESVDVEEKGFSVQTFMTSDSMSAEEFIRQQLYNHTKIIDLTRYNLTVEELSYILAMNKDFMIASGYIKYDYVKEVSSPVKDRIVTEYYPIYLFETIEEDIAGRALINKGIDEYVKEIESLTDDPLERLLILHDKLIEDCEYDDEYKYRSYSLHSVFAYKETVCQGYAQAMYFIGRELGLDVELCSSFKIGHIWNYVRIGDKYYHIDTTWDDPVLIIQYPQRDEDGNIVKDENGDIVIEREERVHRTTALHKNFMMSDETMQSDGTNHGLKNDWMTSMETIPVCDSTKYEKNYLFNIKEPFTTEYNDGYFNVTVNINGRSDVFSTKTLNTDAVIASKGYINSDKYYIFYAFTESIADASFIFAADENSKLSDAKVMVKDAAVGRGIIADFSIPLSVIPYSEIGNNCLYVWSLKTLEPYGKKVYIK